MPRSYLVLDIETVPDPAWVPPPEDERRFPPVHLHLPVLALRSLRHGVAMSWYYQGRVRHRYTEEGHLDLCDMLSDHGAARQVSLDAVARLIGLPGKIGVDGSP